MYKSLATSIIFSSGIYAGIRTNFFMVFTSDFPFVTHKINHITEIILKKTNNFKLFRRHKKNGKALLLYRS